MYKFAAIALACAFCITTVTAVQAFEEKTEVKTKKDGSWKMKVKRSGDHKYVGEYEGKTFELRGSDFGPNFHDNGEYTVYGSIDPASTYITTSRVEPYETTTVVTEPVASDNWEMRVFKRDNHWYGSHGGKEYELRGDHVREEGNFTVHGRMGDGFITTSKVEIRK